mmetsp:Transcript_23612/g.20534  ORF Transcript_23612/g.20534 Transcript_23612/m.20534 type:complete len:93 (-) Transcript_23612:856-1134(-)
MKVCDNLKVKAFDDKPLTGSMILNLTFEFLTVLNNDQELKIYELIESVFTAETRQICDDVTVQYHDQSEVEFNEDKMPMDEDQLRGKYREIT